MLKAKMLNDIQLSVISRFFSSAVIHELARKGRSTLFAKLVREANLSDVKTSNLPIKNIFEDAFSLFSKGAYKNYRQEYIYKSAITKNILLGIHNLNTASMLNEFRVGGCRADVVILNGTATVYEVKSDLDTLNRLEKQISEYRKVFASVYVITGESHLETILSKVPNDVGIMKLSKRFRISKEREAKDSPERTCSEAIFDSIQISEAKKILKFLDIKAPDLPNTQMYDALREIFRNQDSYKVHEGMVEILKKTRSLSKVSDIVNEVPQSLQAAVFSAALRKKDYERLLDALNTPLCEALSWS